MASLHGHSMLRHILLSRRLVQNNSSIKFDASHRLCNHHFQSSIRSFSSSVIPGICQLYHYVRSTNSFKVDHLCRCSWIHLSFQYDQVQKHVYTTSTRATAHVEALALTPTQESDNIPDIEWDKLDFGFHETDMMYVMKCDRDGSWYRGALLPFANLELSPSAGVFNYGQGVFEGLKAYRTENDRILLFRPKENALRMISGADRMCMSALPVESFLQAVRQTVLANKRWIPPPGKGSLYVRALLIGSGPVLGLAPAPEYTFTVYVSPVGNYFKEGRTPIHLKVENVYHRAVAGGTGGVKAIGNYASVLKAQLTAKKEGYSDVLYLDAAENRFLEEVSSCNIFIVKGNEITTPEAKGTVLPGITRKSVIELARSHGYKVSERQVSVDELLDADEVFCTGTAVVVSFVGSITYQEKRILYANQGLGQVSQELYELLTGIQMGKIEDMMGWTMEIQ